MRFASYPVVLHHKHGLLVVRMVDKLDPEPRLPIFGHAGLIGWSQQCIDGVVQKLFDAAYNAADLKQGLDLWAAAKGIGSIKPSQIMNKWSHFCQ